jgi:hypothetical protein
MTQFRKYLLTRLIILLIPSVSLAQSTYLPLHDKSDHFLERLDILLQTNPDLNLATFKPISRKIAVQVAELADSLSRFYPYDDYYHLSNTDQYNLQELLMNSQENVTGNKDGFKSKHPLWTDIYKTKANFLTVDQKDFFLAVDPVFQFQVSKETGNSENVFVNSKGLQLRGLIANHLGFSSTLTDNQERGPSFFQQRVFAVPGYPALPGFGYFKPFKTTAFDYFNATGSINFDVWKYFFIQFGYDKNFIGSGYRSLMLSDFSAPYLFLRIDTRIWKLDYQVLFMELINQNNSSPYGTAGGPGNPYPVKYGVIHHLAVNVTPWLNVGFFDNVIFNRANNFEFSYLNPVIFLTAANQANGDADKLIVGFDFKANVGHTTQFYGQLVFNEFILDDILHYSQGWWTNKQAFQLGVKYINAFNVKSLDLQLEGNLVRPYTYSAGDTVSNYSNYNQPLAHPLGAGFEEFITIVRYQPFFKWNMEAKLICYRQGLDSAGINFGSNILDQYQTRPRDNGFFIGTGIEAKCINLSAMASYQIKENLFLFGSVMYRTYEVHNPSPGSTATTSSTTFTLGVRMNTFRREYDY